MVLCRPYPYFVSSLDETKTDCTGREVIKKKKKKRYTQKSRVQLSRNNKNKLGN
jgi:hypothetical protein